MGANKNGLKSIKMVVDPAKAGAPQVKSRMIQRLSDVVLMVT
jgi:hypothetical protein